MTVPPAVDQDIIDAVNRSNPKVIDDRPAILSGPLFQTGTHSSGVLFEAGMNAQAQFNHLVETARVQGLTQVYTLDVPAETKGD